MPKTKFKIPVNNVGDLSVPFYILVVLNPIKISVLPFFMSFTKKSINTTEMEQP